MKYVFVAALFVIGLSYIAADVPCFRRGQDCTTNMYGCCNGLRCEKGDFGFRCYSQWDSEFNKAVKLNNNVEGSRIVEASEDKTGGTFPFPCLAKGADCQMFPTACCNDGTCEQDVFGHWYCVINS